MEKQPQSNKSSQKRIKSPHQSKGSLSPDGSAHKNSDNMSAASFNTAKSGFTSNFSKTDMAATISKENVIYEKYVEVHNVKFKIVMMNLKEVSAL
mmetsp:Transcript_16196/g.13770  ORF Transcript_16196/g.13770 Transcript_16196/m.13770 type:complete len:95 (-) Transcript_16196:305-589(-)|eukprot:CAMPEP_0114577536 /NCGR_PEP_ID=MMETSP0125-20121206/2188_1 /TAXON_ID=485358 ORGANISM="Aristerostoma sp., Strain ATCC 50986" /NCGR_SAMPLE_ID=MMETSP0125 /ASSEMBLY_ACC=CAM_ASM_000245 /LENGTH=94 /DNA_ID=CAMNT_0001766929 /DNA_START=895 /DNA_END=1179 /DNA_ORIENTATION=-